MPENLRSQERMRIWTIRVRKKCFIFMPKFNKQWFDGVIRRKMHS